MLAIRLRRTGTTKRPYYRVVVADSRAWRDGRFVEVLGHYDPRKNPAVVKIDVDRAKHWTARGRQASDTVRSLLKRDAEAARAARASEERDAVKELLAAFAGSWWTSPSGCASASTRSGTASSLELEVAPDDRGRVIGQRRPHGGRAAHPAGGGGGPAGPDACEPGDPGLTARFAELVAIGRVVKPQGRKGEVLDRAPLRPPRPLPLPAPGLRARSRGRGARGHGHVLLAPQGPLRPEARGRRLHRRRRGATAAWSCGSPRRSSPPLPEGSYYHHQLIGLRVRGPEGRPRWARSRTSWRRAAARPSWSCAGPPGEVLDPPRRGRS